ncbi:MAG: leucyl aminopeptidase [Novosphingobium sp.]|nr:leucyl aminopeptidase [Novosphingobium sp.]MBO9601038.1 leucyl aminopeptidase [Novosphingobium sp.]
MKFTFRDAAAAGLPRLRAQIVDQDALPADLEPAVIEGAEAARFSGKVGQTFEIFVSRGGAVVRLALAGAGQASAADRTAALEKAGAALSARFLTSGETAIALDLSLASLSAEDAAAVLLGLRLRAWRHDYRTRLKDEQKVSLAEAVITGAPAGTEAAWNALEGVVAGVEFTRELVTEPANIIYPESFVERCKARFEGTGVEITVLDETEMAALGMGALLGVAQGSARKPRLLALKWNGGAADEKPVAFVGKGVTFDTGGISIKPAAGMEDMKWDMGGAGAVAGALLALAKRKAKANIVGVCGLVENMPDGNAQRPGDVVTSMSGQTIEVINTDAEGRLVLCDAITWVQKEHQPTAIVDLATLTGAIIISLAHEYAGMFCNDEPLAEKLNAAGKATGEGLWRMPIGPAYDKMIDSPIADMKNVGSRWGGSITAAQFIQRFVETGTPWAHLDIAGTVWVDKPGATWDKGATGFGVRLLDRFVRDNLEA